MGRESAKMEMLVLSEPKPFIKWAGGKRQLLDQIMEEIPESFNNYFEPFAGGGALYFRLWSEKRIKKAYLNDSNPILVNAYRVIKKHDSELIAELKRSKYRNESETFYRIRDSEPEDPIEQSARFIYLNKTAFNGLYRENSKGKFNVPFGRYDNPKICDEDNLKIVAESLKNAEITNLDFEKAVAKAKARDFVYFDPPYLPLNTTSSFTQYTANDFSYNDQVRLRDSFARLGKKGTYALESNSDTDKIRNLYSGYSIREVYASRAINCKADRRGKITELLIKNY